MNDNRLENNLGEEWDADDQETYKKATPEQVSELRDLKKKYLAALDRYMEAGDEIDAITMLGIGEAYIDFRKASARIIGGVMLPRHLQPTELGLDVGEALALESFTAGMVINRLRTIEWEQSHADAQSPSTDVHGDSTPITESQKPTRNWFRRLFG